MTTVDLASEPTQGGSLAAEPLIEVCVDLATGMRVKMDRCVGDVPLLEVITGRARVIFSVDAAEATAIGPEHVALAEEFATAACGLRDELRQVVTGRLRRQQSR